MAFPISMEGDYHKTGKRAKLILENVDTSFSKKKAPIYGAFFRSCHVQEYDD